MASNNQRKYHRQPLDLEALVSAKDIKPVEARIRDFCLGGGFLTFVDSNIAGQVFKNNDLITLHYKVPTVTGFMNFHTHAEIRRIEGNAVGVSFKEPDPAALQALENLASSLDKNIQEIFESEEDSLGNSSKQRIVALCKRCSTDYLSVLTQGFFSLVQDELFNEAEKAKNNTIQRELFDTISLIKKSRGPVATGFAKKVISAFDYFSGHVDEEESTPEEDITEEELSLVNQDEFEDWLIVKVLINKVESDFYESLFNLDARFAYLMSQGVIHNSNPVSPQVICHAFAESIHDIDIPKSTEKIIFSAFEKVLVEKLGSFYKDINDILINSGVLPKGVKVKAKKKEETPAKRAVTPIRVQSFDDATSDLEKPEEKEFQINLSGDSSLVDKEPEDQIEAAVSGEILDDKGVQDFKKQKKMFTEEYAKFKERIATEAYSTLQNILDIQSSVKLSAENDVGSSSENISYAESKKVLDALSNIKLDDDSGDIKRSIVESVNSLLVESYGNDVELSEKHKQVLTGVERLYDSMLNTDRLTDHMTGNFEYMKLPIYKVVIQDESFFEDSNHPARKVLNRMGQLGHKKGVQNLKTQSQVDKVVEEINDKYTDNLEIFDQALDSLDELYHQQKKILERNIHRVTEACEGQQKIDLAKRTVDNEINNLIGDKSVPKALPLLFDSGWKELMNHIYIKKGSESEDWSNKLDIIDLLTIKLGARNNYQQIDQDSDVSGQYLFDLVHKELINTIGQQNINQSSLEELKNILFSLDSNPDNSPELVSVRPIINDEKDSRLIIEADNELDKYLSKAKKLQVGDWLLNKIDENENIKMQLVWLGEDHSKFVFVDHQGKKTNEFLLHEIAYAFSQNKLVYQADGDPTLVEYGLDKMIENIYNELAYQTSHDPLTGLLNRQEFEKQLQSEIELTAEGTHALYCIGLDQFKVINNTCGFEAGDALLVEISQLLTNWMSIDGFIGRLGGDEFGVFLRNCNENDAFQLADNQLNAIHNLRFEWDGKPFTLGASLGLVYINDLSHNSALNFLVAANSALEAAKAAGKNRIEVYNNEDSQFTDKDEIMAWITRLNKALEEDTIKLRCQKIASVIDDAANQAHYEVLLSVVDENGMQLPPVDFIYAAEQYNRMQDVDRWVIVSVFEWMNKNPELLENISGLAINLSGHSFNDDSLLMFIWDKFVELKIPRNKVIFEVTETATITNLEKAADFIREMKEVGCRFALDDFGSGLSSYAYLKHLPVDFVKIDGVFVKEIVSDISDYAMVKSIHEMAKFLGKKTVAEYVENDEILKMLQEIGVDYVQGWGIEKPMMLEDLNESYFVPDEHSALF